MLGAGPFSCPVRAAEPLVVRGHPAVVAADTLRFVSPAGDAALMIRLRGLAGVQFDQRCGRGAAQWDCGIRAATALAAVLRNASVVCVAPRQRWAPVIVSDPSGSPGTEGVALVARCALDGRDLGAHVVRLGWAVTTDPFLRAVQSEAQAARVGLWSTPFVHPAEWFEARLAAVRAFDRSRNAAGR